MSSSLSVVLPAKFGAHAPSGTAEKLRELANAVDRGDVIGVLCAYVHGDEYNFGMWGASVQADMVLATLLHQKALDQFIT